MLGPGITWYLVVSGLLFGIGTLGVMLRRSPLIVLLSLEIMLNAGNLALVGFSRLHGEQDGQVFALAVMAVAAAEVCVVPHDQPVVGGPVQVDLDARSAGGERRGDPLQRVLQVRVFRRVDPGRRARRAVHPLEVERLTQAAVGQEPGIHRRRGRQPRCVEQVHDSCRDEHDQGHGAKDSTSHARPLAKGVPRGSYSIHPFFANTN